MVKDIVEIDIDLKGFLRVELKMREGCLAIDLYRSALLILSTGNIYGDVLVLKG